MSYSSEIELEPISPELATLLLGGCVSVERDISQWRSAPIMGYQPNHSDVKCGDNFIAMGARSETAELLAMAPRLASTVIQQAKLIATLREQIKGLPLAKDHGEGVS